MESARVPKFRPTTLKGLSVHYGSCFSQFFPFPILVFPLQRIINEIHRTINEIHRIINEIHRIINEIHKFINEIHRFINEIHRSKPKPTSVASEKAVGI